ncbi:DUF2712 domain-containing protein [Neobacillus drentensis]|uniref:DUF2712 domain-containing protein n=1 Tax=Neobacillus drentensis TaxID=220684 RepID=UPI002FFF3C1A
MKANQANSRSAPEYRSTTNRYEAWMVNVTESGEGNTAITQYWLENAGGTNVSDAFPVAEIENTKYFPAYDNASQTDVYLTAQNNNYTSDTYGVTGYWDEETGVFYSH